MNDVAGNWNHAYEEALKGFRELTRPKRIAENTGAAYQGDDEKGQFTLRYCGEDYIITYPEGAIRPSSGGGEMPISVQICILLYMIHGVPSPERDDWRTFKDLPQGYHHWAPFVYEALDPLVEGFGFDLEAFKKAGEALEGTPISMGDVGFQFQVLPRIGLQVMLWAGDEEFPPRANILFNGNCVMQVDTATLYMIGIDLSRRLLHRAGKLSEIEGLG